MKNRTNYKLILPHFSSLQMDYLMHSYLPNIDIGCASSSWFMHKIWLPRIHCIGRTCPLWFTNDLINCFRSVRITQVSCVYSYDCNTSSWSIWVKWNHLWLPRDAKSIEESPSVCYHVYDNSTTPETESKNWCERSFAYRVWRYVTKSRVNESHIVKYIFRSDLHYVYTTFLA